MSRIGDLQDIRAMAHALREAAGNEIKDPWPGLAQKPITRPDEIKDPWPGLPDEGIKRVAASQTRGAQAARGGATQRWEQLSKAAQQKVSAEWKAAARGEGLVDPWGPQPPGTPAGWRPPSGL